jgi:hypothetical protein
VKKWSGEKMPKISTTAAQRKRRERPITDSVEQCVWTFAREADKLTISRQNVDDGVMLIVSGEGTPRSYFFRDLERLEIFQRDMETLLLKTGWVFMGYEPERRQNRDRRGWPRIDNDRRRWWTDGLLPDNQPGHRSVADSHDVAHEPRSHKR